MKPTILTLALALFLSSPALAAPVQSGQPLPVLAIKDQHDQDWRMAPETRLVMFAAGRKASNLALAVLASQPKVFCLRGKRSTWPT